MEFWATEYTKLAAMISPANPNDPNFGENASKFDGRESIRHSLFSLGASGLGSIVGQELIEPGWGPAIGGALVGGLAGSGVASIGEKGRAERLGLKLS